MTSVFREETGHSDLSGNHTGTHGSHSSFCSRSDFLELDLDVHTGSKIELHKRVHGLRSGIYDVEHTLVCPNFKLLAALLVDMRATQHGEFLKSGRKRNRTEHLRTRALCGVHDLACRHVEHTMIKPFQADANLLPLHFRTCAFRPCAFAASKVGARRTAPRSP